MRKDQISPDQLRRNRRAATIFGSAGICGLVTLVFVLVKYFPKEEDWVYIISGLLYLVIAGVVVAILDRRRRRKEQSQV